jgi:hypothetical protein
MNREARQIQLKQGQSIHLDPRDIETFANPSLTESLPTCESTSKSNSRVCGLHHTKSVSVSVSVSSHLRSFYPTG